MGKKTHTLHSAHKKVKISAFDDISAAPADLNEPNGLGWFDFKVKDLTKIGEL